jgi:hypothetical protein
MPTATGAHPLETSDDRAESRRWRLISYAFLVVLIVLGVFTQKKLPEVSIRPTGPLPAINIP